MEFLKSKLMNLRKLLLSAGKAMLLATFILFAGRAFSQEPDSVKPVINFKGSVTVTNNGFSFIPSFSLGKPAAILDLSVGGKRLSFEPQFRYSLEGRPWSFIFIWRYKLVKADKFQLTLGTHLPALNFGTVTVEKDSVTQEMIRTQRYFPVFEVSPNYAITKDINLSLFYLYGHGAKEATTKNTHYLSFRAYFSNLRLSKQFYLGFYPQLFYLKVDDTDGFYVASSLTLAKKNFPLSFSTLVNKAIQSDVDGKDFDWNVSLVYSFGSNLKKL